MNFLNVIFVAFIALLGISMINAAAAPADGPCVDKLASTLCTNLAQDCTSKKWAKLIQTNCRKTCGVC